MVATKGQMQTFQSEAIISLGDLMVLGNSSLAAAAAVAAQAALTIKKGLLVRKRDFTEGKAES